MVMVQGAFKFVSCARGLGRTACLALLGALLLAAPPAAAKYASIVIDAESGRVYHETNADTRNYPASLTKMMTLYVLFDQIESGDLTLQTKMKVSAHASRQPSSKMWLEPGSTISVEDAILALTVKSANDVAVVVAEHIGGSERKFASLMTTKARAIGMKRTTFRNASGLPNRGQLSTARDIATLAQRLMSDFPQYYAYFARTSFKFNGTTYRGHNRFVERYQGAEGGKTGYIRASGYNLAASAHRDRNRLIGVVFGGKSASQRDTHLGTLLDKAFGDAALYGLPPIPERKPLMTAKADGTLIPTAITVLPKLKPDETLLKTASWGIQVGAFSISDVAMHRARAEADRLKETYENVVGRIEPVHVGDTTLYRAQVVGLTEADTRTACRIIERAPHDCLIVEPDPITIAQPVDTASAMTEGACTATC